MATFTSTLPDDEILSIAEEGMADYLRELEK